MCRTFIVVHQCGHHNERVDYCQEAIINYDGTYNVCQSHQEYRRTTGIWCDREECQRDYSNYLNPSADDRHTRPIGSYQEGGHVTTIYRQDSGTTCTGTVDVDGDMYCLGCNKWHYGVRDCETCTYLGKYCGHGGF